MKKFVTAMVIILVIGAVMVGVGCAVVGANGGFEAFGKEIALAEHTFNSEKTFDKINLDLHSPHKYVFARGEGYSVRYSDSEERPISVSVSDAGELRMSDKRIQWFGWFWKQATSVVEITVPEDAVLTVNANLSGASEIEIPDWNFTKIDLDLSGAAAIIGTNVNIDVLDLDLSGASSLNVSGVLGTVDVEASGASEITLSGSASALNVEVSGSGKMTCSDFTCPTIDIDASGSVEMRLSGTGSKLDFDASGSGDLYAKDFQVARAEIDISGSVDAEVSVSEYLSVESSGSATVKYWGNPQVDSHGSGSSSVRKMD